jgi:hypothetical protein
MQIQPVVTGKQGGGTSPNLNELWGQSNTTNIDVSAAYNKTMGQHQLDVLVLGTQNEMTANYNTVFRDGLIRGIQSINAGSPVNQTMSGAPSQAGRAAFLGRVNYQYANKYYAEFSMRADGSTKFPENNRWGYFPAVSAGWRISRENFIAIIVRALMILRSGFLQEPPEMIIFLLLLTTITITRQLPEAVAHRHIFLVILLLHLYPWQTPLYPISILHGQKVLWLTWDWILHYGMASLVALLIFTGRI